MHHPSYSSTQETSESNQTCDNKTTTKVKRQNLWKATESHTKSAKKSSIIIATTICPSTGCVHLFNPSKPWPKWWVQSPKAQRLRCCIESVGCSGSGRTRGLTVVNFLGVVSLHKKQWLHGHLHRNSCQEAIHQNEQTPRHQSAPASGIDCRRSIKDFSMSILDQLRTALGTNSSRLPLGIKSFQNSHSYTNYPGMPRHTISGTKFIFRLGSGSHTPLLKAWRAS